MKLFYIINNALKRRIKDYKSLGFMIIFPIFLTFIFITVFGNLDNAFKSNEEEKIEVKMSIYSEAKSEFNEAYLAFLGRASEEEKLNLNFWQAKTNTEALKALEAKEVDLLVSIDQEQSITLYQGGTVDQKAETVKAITESFLENRAIYETMASRSLQMPQADYKSQVQYSVNSLPKLNKNFYVLSIAATMIAFTILMAGSYGSTAMHYIHKAIGKRVQSAPLSKNILYLGEYLSGVILAFIQGCMMVIVSELFFDIGFRNNPMQMIVIIVLLSMMSVAIGVCIGTLTHDEKVSDGMVSLAIMILCFTSGGFNPNMDLGRITEISPITVINRGIIDICIRQRTDNLIQILLITLSVTIICFVIAGIRINVRVKEDYLDDKHAKYSKA